MQKEIVAGLTAGGREGRLMPPMYPSMSEGAMR